MRLKLNIILIFIIFQIFSFSTISVTNASVGDKETPKTATLGANTGNISSNAAGGRFFFNFTVESGKSYNFQLVGDGGTKFDLHFLESNFYPNIVSDDFAEYVDTNSYPVKFEGYSTKNSWAFVQIFSNHIDGGIGDFTLTISEFGNQASSSSVTSVTSTPVGSSSSSANQTGASDSNESPAFNMIFAAFTVIATSLTISHKRSKFAK